MSKYNYSTILYSTMENLFNLLVTDQYFNLTLMLDIISTNNGSFLEIDRPFIETYLNKFGCDDITDNYYDYLSTDEYNMVYTCFYKKKGTSAHLQPFMDTGAIKIKNKNKRLLIYPRDPMSEHYHNKYATAKGQEDIPSLYSHLSRLLNKETRKRLSALNINQKIKEFLGYKTKILVGKTGHNISYTPEIDMYYLKTQRLRDDLRAFIKGHTIKLDLDKGYDNLKPPDVPHLIADQHLELVSQRDRIEISLIKSLSKKDKVEQKMKLLPGYDYTKDPYFTKSQADREKITLEYETNRTNKYAPLQNPSSTGNTNSNTFMVEPLNVNAWEEDMGEYLIMKPDDNLPSMIDSNFGYIYPQNDDDDSGICVRNNYQYVLSTYDWCWLFVNYKYTNGCSTNCLSYLELSQKLINGDIDKCILNSTLATFRSILLDYVEDAKSKRGYTIKKTFKNVHGLHDAFEAFCLLFSETISNVIVHIDPCVLIYSKIIIIYLFNIITKSKKNMVYIVKLLEYFETIERPYFEVFIKDLVDYQSMRCVENIFCVAYLGHFYQPNFKRYETITSIIIKNISDNKLTHYKNMLLVKASSFSAPANYGLTNLKDGYCFCKLNGPCFKLFSKFYSFDKSCCRVHNKKPLYQNPRLDLYLNQITDNCGYYQLVLNPNSMFIRLLDIRYQLNNNSYTDVEYKQVFEDIIEQCPELLDHFGLNTLDKFVVGVNSIHPLNIIKL